METGEPFFVSLSYSNVVMSDMVIVACANCRKIDYEDLKRVEYDLSDKTKKTVDMASFIASRRLPSPLPLPYPCERCRRCCYCSEECKEEHYRSVHRLECEYFAKIRMLEESTPDVGLMDLDWDPPHERTLLRHLVRILVKRHEELCIGSLAASDGASESGEPLMTSFSRMTYQEDVLNLIFKTKMSEEHLRVAAEARQILPLSYLPFDDSELAQVLSRVDCNKFGLFGRKGEVIGSSLHPSASFVNHSCLPNAFSHIVDHKLTLHALYPVEAGEELNISYIEPELPIKERRARLKETYGFDCVCKRCTKDGSKDAPPKQLYDDFFEAHLNCPQCHKGLLMVADEDDVKCAADEAEEDPRLALLMPEPTEGSTSYRCCNNCHKLQTRPIIPTLQEWKRSWVQMDSTAQNKHKRNSNKQQRHAQKDVTD